MKIYNWYKYGRVVGRSIVRMFFFSDFGFVIMIPSFLNKYSIKRFVVFGRLWSNRSRFRLCCTRSFHICVDFYFTEFLPYVFTGQKLETETILKPFWKPFYFLFLKSLKSSHKNRPRSNRDKPYKLISNWWDLTEY